MSYAYEDAVTTYDFLLSRHDPVGITRVSQRLTEFITTHRDTFKAFIAYITQPAYRAVAELSQRECRELRVIPTASRLGRLAFYKADNVKELIRTITKSIKKSNDLP
jgi:hypothetical protein